LDHLPAVSGEHDSSTNIEVSKTQSVDNDIKSACQSENRSAACIMDLANGSSPDIVVRRDFLEKLRRRNKKPGSEVASPHAGFLNINLVS
jgi:4-aminobutyrate aminotransferase-like enzyme